MKNRIPQGWMIPQLPHIKILITEISLEKSSIQQYIYVQFTYLFTSFSRHRPAQSKRARTGLRSHARCDPYPILQPVKVGHTTGVYDPYSFRIVMWVLLRPTSQISESAVRGDLRFFVLIREDQKVLPFADVIAKAALSSQLFKTLSVGLNPRPPAQQTGTLPTKLTRRR